jgi:hypothetical protein
MPLPTGHWEHTSGPRPLQRRERWLIGGVLCVVAIIVVAVVIAFTSHQRKSRDGCIDVSAATVIGGSELYRCGSAARGLCTGATGSGAQNIAFRQALADACRKAGLPVPPVGTHS